MSEPKDVLIVGAGPAGLCLSNLLQANSVDHLVLEAGRVGENWRSKRWDSLRLVGPTWNQGLLGMDFSDVDPDSFMSSLDLVTRLETFSVNAILPVRTDCRANHIRKMENGLFELSTTYGVSCARVVVIATGAFNRARVPAFANRVPSHVKQMTASTYTNPNCVGSGKVLVVGSSQSGCQIAWELINAGKKTVLAVGKHWWRPRRYRGRDTTRWAVELGKYDKQVGALPGGDATKALPTPIQTGINGGIDLNIHTLFQQGCELIGYVKDCVDGQLDIDQNLKENIIRGDSIASRVKSEIDAHIEKIGSDAEEDDWPDYVDPSCYDGADKILALDLEKSDIQTIVWATGYQADYDWVSLPIFKSNGYPFHVRGVTSEPGLFFLGLDWQTDAKSSILSGIGADAEYIVENIVDYLRI